MCAAVIVPTGDDFKRQRSPQGGLSEYEQDHGYLRSGYATKESDNFLLTLTWRRTYWKEDGFQREEGAATFQIYFNK